MESFLSVAPKEVVSVQVTPVEGDGTTRLLSPQLNASPLSLGLTSDRPLPRMVVWGTLGVIALLYALLWSRYWYPLSDASMYLNLARGLAAGRDLEWTRQVHKSIRPLTPIVLSWVIKGGGGIGAMHALLIAFMIVAHALSFLTLRRWVGERVGLVAVAATAMSWWTFQNAFSIMTEPLFLVLFWGCLLTLSYVAGAKTIAGKWRLVALGLLLLALAWFNRVAAILFLPAIVIALELTNRRTTPLKHRLGWAILYAAVFGLLLLEYKRPVRPLAPGERFIYDRGAVGGGLIDAGDAEQIVFERTGQEAYKGNILVGVSNPVVQLPVAGGRWGLEGLMPPMAFIFSDKTQGRAVANVWVALGGAMLGVTAFAVMLWGAWLLVRGRAWWPAALMIYFFPIWLMWGTRVKPRYMLPVMPIIVVCLWLGAAWVMGWVVSRWRRRRAAGEDPGQPRGYLGTCSRVAGGLILAGAVLANVPTYAIEWYLRHGTQRDFYELARKGGFAELVDIGAYVQKNVPADAIIYTNRGWARRIVEYVTGRDVAVTRKSRRDLSVKDAADKQMELIINRVPGRYAVIFYEQHRWPNFHLPFVKRSEETSGGGKYWQLFAWDPQANKFVPVNVPHDRGYLVGVPPKYQGPEGPTTRPMPKPSTTRATTRPARRGQPRQK